MFAGLVPIPERCPWSYIGGKFSNELTAELKKEIGPKYLLYPQRKALLVIAKCDANDDVLVANQHDCGKLFWVHLTWSGKLDDQHDIYPEVGTVRQADLVAFFKRYDQEPICENATFLRPE